MKKMKKVLAVLLSMAMVLGMSVTAFAETKPLTNGPKPGDTAKVEISGGAIKAGKNITFEAYQLIEADFDSQNNFQGYKWVSPYGTGKIAIGTPDKVNGLTNITDLTSTKINEWAANASGGTVETEKVTWTGDTANIDLAVGTWMIIAKSTDPNLIFNPMVASVYYTHKNGSDSAEGGTVNAGGMWQLETENAYEKSTDLSTTHNKEVGGATEGTDGQLIFTQEGASAQVGESKAYKLTGLIPSYSAEYFADDATVVYTLKDSKNEGLKYNDDIQVKVGGNKINPSTDTNKTYTVEWYTDKKFTTTAATPEVANAFKIVFDKTFIQSLAGQAQTGRTVEVVYTAEVTSSAVSQVAENEYVVDYTTKPGSEDFSSSTPKTVYTYTAAINGAIKKVTDSGSLQNGATFKLTYMNGEEETEFGNTFTTGTNNGAEGSINFEGLEFGKTYTLTETAAPDGYSVNTTKYEITCNYPTGFDEKGTTKLTEYTVTVKNLTTGVAADPITVPYGGSATVLDSAVEFVNTTLTNLPSTGGIGTTIFTVVGCIVMIGAAGMFFASRRKRSAE